MSPRIPIVLGTMTFGGEGKEQARVHTLPECQAILDVFKKHGGTELDTARVYCGGTSESFLGELDVPGQGFTLATKCFPGARALKGFEMAAYSHNETDLRRCVETSLAALRITSIPLFYLHAPDRSTSWTETLTALHKLQQEGKIVEYGISNYKASEVEEMVAICKEKRYKLPAVYQGLYNVILRAVEPELLPVLRKNGIAFYAFNPLLGGFLTGRVSNKDSATEAGSRFDPERNQGKMYRARYWNDTYFAALKIFEEVSASTGITIPALALRWFEHHSMLAPEFGDRIIIGASSLDHIEQNLLDFEAGPLEANVVARLDEAWEIVKPTNPVYWH